ncbi:MAG: L,D-transpeptidase family protein [Pseudomonadales bacterium]
MRWKAHNVLLLAFTAFAAAIGHAVATDPALPDAIRLEVEQLRFSGRLSLGDVDIASGELLADYYEQRNFAPAWSRPDQVASLRAAIDESVIHGLNPQDYHHDKLDTAWELLQGTPSTRERAVIDLALTDSLIRLGYHHHYGKINAHNLDPHWNFVRPLLDRPPGEVIQETIDSAEIGKTLELLLPRVPMYHALQTALAEYRALAAQGGWQAVLPGATLKPGAKDERIPQIRARLRVTGDYSDMGTSEAFYDAPLQQAVRHFQQRHGLEADGIIGAATFAAMNVPVSRRIEQLRASLERARWAVHSITDDYLIVNIASFTVRLVRGGQTVWESKVQVGSEYHQSPVFRGNMKYVVLRPTWTVPYSIATKEMLPRIQREADYFQTRDFDIKNAKGELVDADHVPWQSLSRKNFGYTFVQRPGPNNALGQVKFIFPNEHAVYLHDTPSKALFDKAKRAFSHGCIRLDQPLDLAELLLADKGWSRERIESNLETKTVFLSQPLPVLLMYWTAAVSPAGEVQFFNDIYGRDDAVIEALAAPFVMERPEA